jgi:hypothetical protein
MPAPILRSYKMSEMLRFAKSLTEDPAQSGKGFEWIHPFEEQFELYGPAVEYVEEWSSQWNKVIFKIGISSTKITTISKKVIWAIYYTFQFFGTNETKVQQVEGGSLITITTLTACFSLCISQIR